MSRSLDMIRSGHTAVLAGVRAIIRYLKDCCDGQGLAKWEAEQSFYEGFNPNNRTDEQSLRLGNALLKLPSWLMMYAKAADKKAQWTYARDMLVSWTTIHDIARGHTGYEPRAQVQEYLKIIEAEIERLNKRAKSVVPDAPDGVN